MHKNEKERTHSIGTLLYNSPEQVRILLYVHFAVDANVEIAGRFPPSYLQKKGMGYGQKGDVYSLGVIFFEMNHPLTVSERVKVGGG